MEVIHIVELPTEKVVSNMLATEKSHAERKWRLTKLQVQPETYTGLRESHKQQIHSAKPKFYTPKMYQCIRDNKSLFRIIDDLVKRKSAPKLPSPAAGTAQLEIFLSSSHAKLLTFAVS